MYRHCLLTASLLSLMASPVWAADTLPPVPLDGQATGKVSSATTSPRGTLRGTVSFHGSEGALKEDALGRNETVTDAEQGLLRDAHRVSVLFTGSLLDDLELNLGLHGSYEHVKSESRDTLFSAPEAAQDPSEPLGWTSRLKQSGFAGASLLAKWRAYQTGDFSVAVAPFIESGAGEKASYSLTRSVAPKAGWMTVLTYGAKGVGDISLNGGYRYRDPEEVGHYLLRNEAFYQGHVRASLTQEIAVVAGAQGRKIMVANKEERDTDGKLIYKAREGAELTGGVEAKWGTTKFSAYLGSRVENNNGFGFGQAVAGLSLSREFGGATVAKTKRFNAEKMRQQRQKSKTTAAQNEAEQKKKAAAAAAAAEAKRLEAAYPEMIGRDIDPLSSLENNEGDDFKEVDQKLADERKALAGQEDESKKIDEELEQLRAAKEKAEAEAKRQEEIAEKAAQKKAKKRIEQEDRMMQEWMEEAAEEAENFETITDDEVNWNGLD